jgi:hypothetical protein
MTLPNRIAATFDKTTSDAATGKLQEIQELLPFLMDLTLEERQTLPKMGDKSQAFVDRCLELATQDDSFLPRSLDVPAFRQDRELHAALEPLRQRVAKLLELIEDTQMLAGSEAYLAALEVYHAAKRGGQGSGLDDLLGRMGRRFTATRAATEKESGTDGR